MTVTPQSTRRISREEEAIAPAVTMAFARLHKAAFGIATGVAGALVMGWLTLSVLVLSGAQDFPLNLMNEYFAGFDVSWRGLAVGMAWGGLVGFVAGWFAAFTRNFALATMAFFIRTRAELGQTRDFLDHI
jgi:hypothetical protein